MHECKHEISSLLTSGLKKKVDWECSLVGKVLAEPTPIPGFDPQHYLKPKATGVANACNVSTQKVEGGGAWVQVCPWLSRLSPPPKKKEEKGRKTKEEESKARQTQGNVRY